MCLFYSKDGGDQCSAGLEWLSSICARKPIFVIQQYFLMNLNSPYKWFVAAPRYTYRHVVCALF